ncbi:hypothetical protein MTX20_35355 [Bradyrhizobium sp. ISRA435]|nr:hypothetical protein MTX20_35355 [Bradyrhizobium sp. ISRA435]
MDSEARLAKKLSIQLDISIRAALDLALAKKDLVYSVEAGLSWRES